MSIALRSVCVTKRKGRRGAREATDAELIEQFFSDSRGQSAPRAEDRKLKQLAREVYRVLSQALAELEDPRLASAYVVAVRPAPDAGRVAVEVSAGGGATASDVETALAAARAHLRGELAGALARKRIPELVFEVVP
jgi:ribosome-binding factor A